MPRRLRNSLLAGLFALALAGCGSGDEGTIPPEDAQTLITLTDAVRSDVTDGDCEQARAHANELADQVRALPAAVDPDVRKGLGDAAANLVEQTQDPDQCEAATGASGETGVVTETESTTTPTTETTTQETTTEEQTTTEDEETGSGGAQGQGNGGGPPQTPPGQATPPGQSNGNGGADNGAATGEFHPSGGTEAP